MQYRWVAKGNLGVSSSGFCVRDSTGNFIYAEATRLLDGDNLLVEAKALIAGLEGCINKHYLPVVMETDSLVMKNVLECSVTTRTRAKTRHGDPDAWNPNHKIS